MNKFSRILAAGAIFVLAAGLAGCQNQAPAKTPEEVLKDGMNKLSGVTSYKYNVDVNADLKGPEGQPPAVVKADFNMNGGVDMTTPTDPKFNLKLKGNFTADADGGDGEFELRMNKESLFLSLLSLNGTGNMQVPEDFKAQFVGKWWKLPIPPEALAEVANSIPKGQGEENLTEEQKKMKELVQNTKFFKDTVYVNNEKVMGEDSYHYTAQLDVDALIEFVKKANELQGVTVEEGALEEMKAGFARVKIDGHVYVGVNSGVINKFKGLITLQPKDNSEPTGTISVSIEMSDFNKPVTVEAPADAMPIPLEALAGLAGGAPAPAPSGDLEMTVPADSGLVPDINE